MVYGCKHFHPNRGSKWTPKSLKKLSYFNIKCTYQASFPRWRSLGCKFLAFYSGVQNVHIRRWRNGHILIKDLLLKFIFQYESHLYEICLFYILSICCKFLLFQFLSCAIRMHILILTGVQNERLSKNAKIAHILNIKFSKQLQIVYPQIA